MNPSEALPGIKSIQVFRLSQEPDLTLGVSFIIKKFMMYVTCFTQSSLKKKIAREP